MKRKNESDIHELIRKYEGRVFQNTEGSIVVLPTKPVDIPLSEIPNSYGICYPDELEDKTERAYLYHNGRNFRALIIDGDYYISDLTSVDEDEIHDFFEKYLQIDATVEHGGKVHGIDSDGKRVGVGWSLWASNPFEMYEEDVDGDVV